eukprot:2455140-Pyramimonas_sp.AAC.1
MLGNLAGWLAGVREQCGKQLLFWRLQGLLRVSWPSLGPAWPVLGVSGNSPGGPARARGI